mmetsp:Transcript_7044/g.12510  ORF Transcript_7044/g.12510 Transcript_7044/m.12510 type:complete len:282 (+) Transcript_7044:163-1008(+)
MSLKINSTISIKKTHCLFWYSKTHRHLGRLQRPLGNLVGSIRPLLQNAPQILLIGPNLSITLLNRFQMRHHRLCKYRLEIPPFHILYLLQNILLRTIWLHGQINIEKIRRLGPLRIVPLNSWQAVRLTPLNLITNHLRGIEDIDARSVRRVRLGHFVRPVRQAHHARSARLDDHRLRLGEGGITGHLGLLAPLLVRVALAVLVVEPADDVAGQFEMLALILAHGDAVGLVEEDVGRHEHGVGEEPDADGFRIASTGGGGLFGLVFVLDHAFEPVHGRGAVE